jgi:hypothetical protein
MPLAAIRAVLFMQGRHTSCCTLLLILLHQQLLLLLLGLCLLRGLDLCLGRLLLLRAAMHANT